MKTVKRILAVMMTVLMLVSSVSVGMTSTAASKKKVKKIKLNKTSITIYVGETYKLKATVSPSNASNKKVTWSSSDKKIATVSSSGKVTAKKAGKATITVKAKDGSKKKATCKVTVKKATKVSKIKLSEESISLKVGKTKTIKATISPSKATNKKVSWSSSDKKVATVSSKGKITAKGVGTAKITCKAKDGSGKKATVKVKVTAVKVTKVALNKTSATMPTNTTLNLSATVSPSNATNKGITWKSSDTSIATVSSSGVVTALKKGVVTITATAKDGSKKNATCKITIDSIGASSINLSKTAHEGSPNTTLKLTATLQPSNVSKKTLTWKSSNSSVASVDSNGNVKLLKDGTAKITVTTTDGTNKSASCTVTVKTISVTSVKLSATKVDLTTGGTYKLTATVSPSNATNKAVTWTSNNSTVATVDSNGNIRAIKAGTATITVTTKDGSKKATCTVTVTPKVTEIAVYPSSFSWYLGKTGKMTAIIQPEGATQAVTWSSSDEEYVTVDANGNVKVIKEPRNMVWLPVVGWQDAGHKDLDVTITATAKDGSGVKGTYTLTIEEKVDVTGIEFAKDDKGNALNDRKFYVGQTFDPIIKYSPDNASEQTSTYTSSNTNVAKVQENGSILMVGKGSATITATSVDKGKTATWDITVEEPSLMFTPNTKSIETVVGKTVALVVVAAPNGLLSRQGIEFEIENDDVLKFISYTKTGAYCSAKFAVVGSGETKVTAITEDGLAITEEPAVISATELVVDTYYEELTKGSTVTVSPKVYKGDQVLDGVSISYMIPIDEAQYFKTGWTEAEDGSAEFTIAKDLPEDGAHVDIIYSPKGSSSNQVIKTIYFTKSKFVAPPINLSQIKTYSEFAATKSKSVVRDKEVNYLNTKASNSSIGINASGSILAPLINIVVAANKDMFLEEIGMSPEDVVYEMFTDSTYETENDIFPMIANCDESIVEKITLNENKGSTTFEMVLELKDMSKMGIDAVASSQYAKVMPVIDKTYVTNFADEMKTAMGDNSANEVSFGTLNQTYKDGKVVLTINKITDQVEKVEYYFKSDMDFANAKMVMAESMEEFGTLNVTVNASFTMTVEEKLTYYKFEY